MKPSEAVERLARILSERDYNSKSEAFMGIQVSIMRFLYDEDLTIVKRERKEGKVVFE